MTSRRHTRRIALAGAFVATALVAGDSLAAHADGTGGDDGSTAPDVSSTAPATPGSGSGDSSTGAPTPPSGGPAAGAMGEAPTPPDGGPGKGGPGAGPREPHIAGTVTTVDGDTITVKDDQGFTRVIQTDDDTTVTNGGDDADLDSIAKGDHVDATGTVDDDGTTLDATAIRTGEPKAPAAGDAPKAPAAGSGSTAAPKAPSDGSTAAPTAPGSGSTNAPKAPSKGGSTSTATPTPSTGS